MIPAWKVEVAPYFNPSKKSLGLVPRGYYLPVATSSSMFQPPCITACVLSISHTIVYPSRLAAKTITKPILSVRLALILTKSFNKKNPVLERNVRYATMR
jgi:hypothetical protein